MRFLGGPIYLSGIVVAICSDCGEERAAIEDALQRSITGEACHVEVSGSSFILEDDTVWKLHVQQIPGSRKISLLSYLLIMNALFDLTCV